jgi:hypothetical protein
MITPEEFEDRLLLLLKDAYQIQKATTPGEQAAFDGLSLKITKAWQAAGIDPYQESYKIFATLVMIRDYVSFIQGSIPDEILKSIYWFMSYMAFVWWNYVPEELNRFKHLLDEDTEGTE